MKQSPCDYISKQRGSTRNLEGWRERLRERLTGS